MDETQHLCPYCKYPQPRRDCLYCPAGRLREQLKDNNIDYLQKELLRLKDVDYEVDFQRNECRHLKKQLEEVLKELHDLKKDYSDQKRIIKKLQKEKIEAIGKVLVTFMFNQSDDS